MKIIDFPLHKKSVFISWLLSYFAVIAVCVSASSILYFQAEKIVADEMNEANTTLIQQIQQAIDSRLDDVRVLGNQIAMDKGLQEMYYLRDPLTNQDYYAALQTVQDFSILANANNFVQFFYTYFNRFDSYPSPEGTYNNNILMQTYFRNTNLSPAQLRSLENGTYYGKFMPLYDSAGVSGPKTIAYLKSLTFNDPDHIVTLFILFDESKLLDSIHNLNHIGQRTVYIIDSQNQVIAASRGKEAGQAPRNAEFERNAGLIYRKINGRKSAICYQKSTVNDWTYVTSVPVSIYKEKVEYLRQITYIGILLSLLLGGFIALFFSWKNYHPVGEIVSAISRILKKNENFSLNENNQRNELNFIREFIQSTQSERDKYFKGWKQNAAAVRNSFLNRLLKGDTSANLTRESISAAYNIRFATDWFAVLLFGIEDYHKFFDEPGFEARQIVMYAVSNVVEEIVSRKHPGLAVECSGMVACLVNPASDPGEESKKDLLSVAEESKRVLENKLGIYVTVSVSRIHLGVKNISQAYREAVGAMEYRIILGTGILIDCDKIKPTQRTYFYSLETERRMINSIKAGDYENAIVILDNIFRKNLTGEYLPTEMIRCFMFSLINTMVQAVNEISVLCESTFLDSLQVVERLLKCRTLPEMRTEMERILRNICGYIAKLRQTKRNDKLKYAVQQYVREHYREADMSIASIAEAFHMSANSLPRLYREQTGGSLLDYINRYRVQRSKELIKRGMSNTAVAEGVGYSNTHTFLRIFKKLEGITPGAFRNTYFSEELPGRGRLSP